LAFWHAYASDIAASEAWLKSSSQEIAAAQEVVDRAKYASSWDSREPRSLECLKQVTLAFPEEPSVWAKTLILNENGTGSVSGSTTNAPNFHEVLDKMQQNAVFVDPRMTHLREAGRDSRDDEFIINFTFRGAK
jgi:hypothetical protein